MAITRGAGGRFWFEWVVYGGMALILGAVFGYMILHEHELIRDQERKRLRDAALVTASVVEHQLGGIVLALDNIRSSLPSDWRVGPRSTPVLRNRLKVLAGAMTGVRTFIVLDAAGRAVASSQDAFVGRDFPQRPYFQVPRSNPRPDVLFVSSPYQGVLGSWLINISRAIVDPNGEFIGVVSASLDPKTLGIALHAVLDAPDTWAAIIHGDGTLFVWEPLRAAMLGKNLARPGAFFFQHMASGRASSFYEGEVFATKEESFMALHSVQPGQLGMDHPLVVGVGRNLNAALSTWRTSLRVHLALYAVMIIVGGVGLFLAQRWRNRSEGQLRAAQAELESFFSIAPDLLALVDMGGLFRRLNPAWEKNMGYRVSELEGRSVFDLIHPEDRESGENVFGGVGPGDGVSGFVARFLHKNATYRFLEWSVVAHGDFLFAAAHDITERRETETHLRNLAYHDRLTGLPNRALFFDRLAQTISAARRSQKNFAILFADLDGFKAVNDEHGHDAGDIVLKTVAERFVATVRGADTVARMGGDEFVFILQDIGGRDGTAAVAQKLLDVVGEDIALSPVLSCRVGVSIGISLCPDNGTDMDDLLMAADTAMYRSKKGGKNRFVFAGDPGDDDGAITLGAEHVVGVGVIDDQHRRMVELVNRLAEVARAGGDALEMERRFTELVEFTSYHFMTEHRLMEEHGYPDRARHDMAHAHLLDEIQRMKPDLFKAGRQFLSLHLKKWTLDHVLAEDMALGAFLREQGGMDA